VLDLQETQAHGSRLEEAARIRHGAGAAQNPIAGPACSSSYSSGVNTVVLIR
jgi:hypothetical protein